MIYTFNTKDNIIYQLMKSYFKLSDLEVYHTIHEEFERFKQVLRQKGIDYKSLKGALIPNQEKDKHEICLVIDTSQIENSFYGYEIFKTLLPCLDQQSTYSVLCGDYIAIIKDKEAQSQLKYLLNYNLKCYNKSNYRHSTQYYFIYFNRLTSSQLAEIIKGLCTYKWFVGYIDVTFNSSFKNYIAHILVHSFIKNKNKVILSHPSDCSDYENMNVNGYPFNENGFMYYSINEELYYQFLSYKIESKILDKEDVAFSINSLFPKFQSIDGLDLDVDDNKWYNYLTDEEKKGKLLNTLGFKKIDKEKFKKQIFESICSNYIYNLEENEYGLKFNICVDLMTVNGNMRKTMIALKYLPAEGRILVITVT